MADLADDQTGEMEAAGYPPCVPDGMLQLNMKDIFRLIVHVHGEQRDKSGEPYLAHLLRVMSRMDNDYERAAALLHDAIEDADPFEKMRIAHQIYVLCGADIGDAVIALTHWGDEPYDHYLSRVARNPLAKKVKTFDCLDNMDESRLRKLPPETADRLRKKYLEAWDYLMGIVR